MANYATLKAAIQNVIKTNGNNEITGELLQQSLVAMINSLGDGYHYKGVATPTTNPGTPDQNVFYIASTSGTYANFGGIVVDGEVAILKYNGAWSKDSTGAASLEKLNQLGQKTIKYFSFSGAGNTPIDAIIQLVPGVKYRFYLSNTWDITGIQSACFSIQHYVNGNYENDVVVYSNPASYYDITAVSAEHYLIRFRGAAGSTLGVHVEEYTSVLDVGSVTIDSLQNVVSENLDDQDKIPLGVSVINQSIATTLNFLGNGISGAFHTFRLIEGKTYKFTLSKTEWNDTSQTALFSITHTHGETTATDLVIYEFENLKKTYIIKAVEADYYTVRFRGNVGETLSVYIEEVVSGGVLFDSIETYSAIASISNRFGILFSIPKQCIKVKVSGTIANGYRFAVKTIPNISTAIANLYLSGGVNYYDSGWLTENYECNLLNVEHTVLAIVVGKTNNGNISKSEALSACSSLSLNIKIVDMVSKLVNYSVHKCEMIAHRGTFFFKMPENSLDSFALAERLGYDFIECDVRATSDGKYVIMHDASINRTCVNSNNTTISNTVNVADTPYDVLRANYVLKSNNPEYRKPIPSLEEYLYEVKSSKCRAMIELEPLTNTQVQEVYDICRGILGDGRFAFNSGQYGELDYIRSIDDEIELFYETTGIIDTVSTIDGSTRNHPKNAWYPSYAGTYGQVNATVIKQYHAKGMRVGVWIVPASDFSSVIAMGVDFIATNDIVPCMSNVSAYLQRFDRNHRSDYYTTDGTVDENGIVLTNGQSIAFGSVALDAGMMIIRIIAKGSFTITTNTPILTTNPNPAYTNISKVISSADFTTIEIPVLYACTIIDAGGNLIMTPRLTIAASDNSVIKNVEIYNVRINH